MEWIPEAEFQRQILNHWHHYSFKVQENILKKKKIHRVDHSYCSLQVLIYSCPFFLFKIMVSLWNVQPFQGTLSIYIALCLWQWNFWHWLVERVWSTEYLWIFYLLVVGAGRVGEKKHGWNICSPGCMKIWKALLGLQRAIFYFPHGQPELKLERTNRNHWQPLQFHFLPSPTSC